MTKNDDQELFDDLSRQSTPERTSAAAARLRTAERRQVALRAVCLDDLVPNDQRVRMVGALSKGSTCVGSHLGVRISNFDPKKPSNVRISTNYILTLDGSSRGLNFKRHRLV
jgi:hypothetical protein